MFAPRLQTLVDPVPQQVVRRPDHTVHHLRLRNQRWRRCSGNRPHQIVPPLWYLHVSWTFYVDRYTSCLVTFRWRDSFKGKFHVLFLSKNNIRFSCVWLSCGQLGFREGQPHLFGVGACLTSNARVAVNKKWIWVDITRSRAFLTKNSKDLGSLYVMFSVLNHKFFLSPVHSPSH